MAQKKMLSVLHRSSKESTKKGKYKSTNNLIRIRKFVDNNI